MPPCLPQAACRQFCKSGSPRLPLKVARAPRLHTPAATKFCPDWISLFLRSFNHTTFNSSSRASAQHHISLGSRHPGKPACNHSITAEGDGEALWAVKPAMAPRPASAVASLRWLRFLHSGEASVFWLVSNPQTLPFNHLRAWTWFGALDDFLTTCSTRTPMSENKHASPSEAQPPASCYD